MFSKCLLGMFFVFVLVISFVSAAGNLEIGSLLLKVSMSKDDSKITKDITLTSAKGGVFNIKTQNLPNVNVSESTIKLNAGDSKSVSVIFDGISFDEGVYVGNVIFEGPGEMVALPVILEVESADLFFDANVEIPVNYNEVPSGSKLVANVKIFDLVSGKTQEGLGSSPLVIEYKIFSTDGNILSSETESIVVNGQANLAKTFSFPEGTSEGNYVLGVVIRYKSSIATSTNMFRIVTPGSSSLSFFRSIDPTLLVVLIVIVIFFAGLMFAFFYLIKDRDKLFGELRRYNELEMTKQQQLLNIQKQIIQQKLENSDVKDKEKVKKKVQKEIVHKVEALKVRQKNREKVLTKMKKEGASDDKINNQLNRWKKEGYNTMLLESKLGVLSTADMKKLVTKWKSSYST